jgi:hypothetical protein
MPEIPIFLPAERYYAKESMFVPMSCRRWQYTGYADGFATFDVRQKRRIRRKRLSEFYFSSHSHLLA